MPSSTVGARSGGSLEPRCRAVRDQAVCSRVLDGRCRGWVNWSDGIEHISLHRPRTVVDLDPLRTISDNTRLNGLSITVKLSLSPKLDSATTTAFAIIVTGDVPGEVAEEVGRAVPADFPDVMTALAAAAKHAH